MRRYFAVAIAVFAFLGVLAPPAFAQAPAPKVTIEGLVDQTMSYTNNISIYDNDVTRAHDKNWNARMRGNLYITGEVGKVKAFIFLKNDIAYGSATGGSYGRGSDGKSLGGGPFGTTDGNLQAEIQGSTDLVELYTEFPLTGDGGLLPFIDKPGLARVGFQNFDVDTYKLGALAWGFYAGLHAEVDVAPGFKITNTYAQLEDNITGHQDGFTRGDDYARIHTLEMSGLMKGLNLKPVYAVYAGNGTTTGFAGPRRGAGGVSDTSSFFPNGANENRTTLGIDATYTSGPWSLAPTFYYQTGTREMVSTTPNGKGKRTCGGSSCVEQEIEAFLVDIQGGWQNGPLNLEGLFVYSPGNKANEDVRAGRTIHYYQPISTDAVYGVNWGHIVAITYDYKQQLGYGATGVCPACGVSYDKYGRLQVGARASYNVTPAFKLRGVVTALWTAEDVDTHATVGQGGLTPYRTGAASKGSDSYLGTETDFGFEWKFAPNITFATIYAHLFTGDALGNGCGPTTGTNQAGGSCPSSSTPTSTNSPKDVDAFTTMLRFVF